MSDNITKLTQELKDNLQAVTKAGEDLVAAMQEEREAQKIKLNSLYGAFSPCCPKIPVSPEDDRFGQRFRLPQNLDHLSWSEIKRIESLGPVKANFCVGDTKTVKLRNGEKITLRIIGLYHDVDAFGRRIPITWEMVDYMKTEAPMNDDWTNKGGWAHSSMRKYLNEDILPLLPDDLLSAIIPAQKETTLGGTLKELEQTKDSLFLLSEWEKYGRLFYAAAQEGHWYEFYAQEGTSYAKTRNGKRDWGWLRSPYGSGSTTFCSVTSSGDANHYTASGSIGVAFGLCT